MADREKVIKGLESRLDDLVKYADSDEVLTLTQDQAKDILALIKEQESEILKFIECVAILTAENEMLKKDNLAKSVLHEHQVNNYLNKRLANRPEIVRCKDCKYGEQGIWCTKHIPYHLVSEDWFCADGERKEGR